MAVLIVSKTKIFAESVSERGASVTEVLLSMAIVAMAAPFVYNQILSANNTVTNIAIANDIVTLRSPALNFVRQNQDMWPDTAQIKLDETELASISEFPTAGFIDKYTVRGATVTDVYLAFDLQFDELRTNQIARSIGSDAAVVAPDGVAYGASWAVAAPDFQPGNLIYRISRDITGQDKSIYLHRGTSGDDGLNQMQRNLNMGGNDIYNVGTVSAKNASVRNATTTFLESDSVASESVYFSSGANLNGEVASMGSVRVTGDITGFRNINADKFNDDKYTTNGRIITDRATVTRSVNVGNDFVLKSGSARTVSGFVALSTNSVYAPFVSATEMTFFENFGLTVSSELLVSSTPPLKIGGWAFPSANAPSFSSLTFSRASIPSVPNAAEFSALMQSGWRGAEPETNETVLRVQSLF